MGFLMRSFFKLLKNDSTTALSQQFPLWLKRVFQIDIEFCPECGGKFRAIACIEDPQPIGMILAHGRSREAAAGEAAARAPPRLKREALRLN
jgi:hypothetical protein